MVSGLVNVSKKIDERARMTKNTQASGVEINPAAIGLFEVLDTSLSIL